MITHVIAAKYCIREPGAAIFQGPPTRCTSRSTLQPPQQITQGP